MGLIKRNNSKNWYVQIRHKGKVYIRSTQTSNKREAQKVEKQVRDEIFNVSVLGDSESITIAQALDLYIDSLADKPRAQRDANSYRRFVDEHLDTNRQLETFTSRDIERLKTIRLRNGNKNATIVRMFNFIRMFHSNAQRLGYKVQPLEFPTVKPDKHKLRYLSIEEERALLKELQPNDPNQLQAQQDNYDLVVMLLDTGARYNEVASLKWTDIDLQNNTIKLYRPKVHNQSILSMSDRLRTVLSRRYKDRVNEYVFISKDGGSRKYSPIAIKKAMKRAGLKDVTLHTLRHTFASRMVQHGMSLQEVSQLLGHTDIKMSSRYAHLEQRDVSLKAADLINKLNDSKPDLKAVK